MRRRCRGPVSRPRTDPGADTDTDTDTIRVLGRADTAGAVRGFINGLVARNCDFSVGGRVSATLVAASAAVAPDDWVPARDSNGQVRRGSQVAELDVTLDPPSRRQIRVNATDSNSLEG